MCKAGPYNQGIAVRCRSRTEGRRRWCWTGRDAGSQLLQAHPQPGLHHPRGDRGQDRGRLRPQAPLARPLHGRHRRQFEIVVFTASLSKYAGGAPAQRSEEPWTSLWLWAWNQGSCQRAGVLRASVADVSLQRTHVCSLLQPTWVSPEGLSLPAGRIAKQVLFSCTPQNLRNRRAEMMCPYASLLLAQVQDSLWLCRPIAGPHGQGKRGQMATVPGGLLPLRGQLREGVHPPLAVTLLHVACPLSLSSGLSGPLSSPATAVLPAQSAACKHWESTCPGHAFGECRGGCKSTGSNALAQCSGPFRRTCPGSQILAM